jgi:hypothetical protein
MIIDGATKIASDSTDSKKGAILRLVIFICTSDSEHGGSGDGDRGKLHSYTIRVRA